MLKTELTAMATGSTSTGMSFNPLGNPYSSPEGYLQTKSNNAKSLTAAGSPPETHTARILSTASSYLHTPEDQILAALTIKGGVRSHLIFFLLTKAEAAFFTTQGLQQSPRCLGSLPEQIRRQLFAFVDLREGGGAAGDC